MPTLSILAYRFGPFELRTEPPALYRDGQPVSVTPKALATLAVLVSNAGRAVSKEDLLTTIWSDTAVVESNLSQNVYTLRKLLSADFPDQNPIENVPRFGYRFTVAVRVQPVAQASQSDFQSALHTGPAESPSTPLEPISNIAPAVAVTAEPSSGAVQTALPRAGADGLHFARWMLVFPVLLLAVPAIFYIAHGRAVQHPELEFVRFTSNTNENRVTAVAIAPDGRQIAYADADGVVLRGEHDIATRSIRTPEARQIERLSWSPDDRHILVSTLLASRAHQLWMLSTEGGVPTLVRDHAGRGTISPSGADIAFTSEDRTEVWVMGRTGTDARPVLTGSPNDTFPVVLWSADGKRLLLERRAAFQSDGHFHSPRTEDEIEGFHATYLAVDVASGHITASEDGIRISDACLLPANRLLFARTEETEYGDWSSFWKVNIDATTGAFRSAPERVRDFSSMRLVNLSAAAKTGGIAAVFTHGQPGIYVGSLSTAKGTLENVKLLTAGKGGPHGWTSDSSAVVFESETVDPHHYHIYKQDLTRREPESLTASMGGEVLPRPTPDSRSVLFQAKSQDGTQSIWRVPLAGGAPTRVHQGQLEDYRCPSSGATCVLMTVLDKQQLAFFVLDPTHGKGQHLLTVPASWLAHGDWDVSPDGTQVAVISLESLQPEIRVIQLSSGKTQEILVPISSPLRAINWMHDGSGWIVATSTALGNELLYVDGKGTPRILRETATSTWGVPSPDGMKLAFADKDVDSNVWTLP